MSAEVALFSTKDFASQLQGTRDAALKEIASIYADELLNTSPSTLVTYFVDKYKVEVPLLDDAAITVDQSEGSQGSLFRDLVLLLMYPLAARPPSSNRGLRYRFGNRVKLARHPMKHAVQ